MTQAFFDEQQILYKLKHYLPTQAPLKDFIHHNALHAFQHLKFYDAIFKVSKIFGYQVTLQLSEYRKLHETGRIKWEILDKVIIDRKGKDNLNLWKRHALFKKYQASHPPRIGMLRQNWKTHYHLDLDSIVQPLLFRVLCSYLNQGVSIWPFPLTSNGFIASLKELEQNSFTSLFKGQRAKKLLLEQNNSIADLLKIVVGNEKYYDQYLFDQQFSHRGWSGMVAAVEQQPHTLLSQKSISLHDLIVFELLLEIDALDQHHGKNWLPLSNRVTSPPLNLFEPTPPTELTEILKIWQDAYEWSYYDEVLAGIASKNKKETQKKIRIHQKSFQALFCIDERASSLRGYIENTDTNCETFGTPGFFSVEFFFQPDNKGKLYHKLCPATVKPMYLIKEYDVKDKRQHELPYTYKTHTIFTRYISSLTLGFGAVWRLILNLLRPKLSPAVSNAFAHQNKNSKLTIENKDINDVESGLQIGFTIEEMTTRVESLLKGIGLIKGFAPLIYIIGHGSGSANNHPHGAYDCSACGGMPGSVNARVFSFMANHPEVRELLKRRGITIPSETQFVSGMHDTTADKIEYYDTGALSLTNINSHEINIESFEKALDLNAKERSRRFAAINTKTLITKAKEAIRKRSVCSFEPRPELGHATNTLCVVGSRSLTKNLLSDRCATLNSYDHRNDPEGKLLTGIMNSLMPLCGGINLEYYFSRVDNYKSGAGTKLLHHIMGLFGVANSSDGDLRPELLSKMIELHEPVRLLIIVEHFPEVILKTIRSIPEIYEWFVNEWGHLAAIHPETNEVYYFKAGAFVRDVHTMEKINFFDNIHALLEKIAKEMKTNNIVDLAKENLPAYISN